MLQGLDLLHNALPFFIVLPPIVYAIATIVCGWAFFCKRLEPIEDTPAVTILKPVKGADAESFENFSSFCRQDYPVFQIVFAVASLADPAIKVIDRLKNDFPHLDIELVVDNTIYGPNYKVCNLINAWPRAKHDIVIVCDSDIRVPAGYLRAVAAPFADEEVGLVTSLYRTSRVEGVAAAIEATGFTVEMIPNVMVALALEGLTFALGASMAVRRAALDKIGGFRSLVDYLADDYQLGNKVHGAGYRIELSPCFVESVIHREGLSSVLTRQIRWGRTMRVSRPGGYLGSVITQPLPFAMAALALMGFSYATLAALVLLFGVRAIAAIIYSRRFVHDGLMPRWLWLLPIRDSISFITWILAFMGKQVRWRGHRYRLLSGGRIVDVG